MNVMLSLLIHALFSILSLLTLSRCYQPTHSLTKGTETRHRTQRTLPHSCMFIRNPNFFGRRRVLHLVDKASRGQGISLMRVSLSLLPFCPEGRGVGKDCLKGPPSNLRPISLEASSHLSYVCHLALGVFSHRPFHLPLLSRSEGHRIASTCGICLSCLSFMW